MLLHTKGMGNIRFSTSFFQDMSLTFLSDNLFKI